MVEVSDEYVDTLDIELPHCSEMRHPVAENRPFDWEPAAPPAPKPPPAPRSKEAPELRFAADSLMAAVNDRVRASWVLERLKPIESKYPGNTITPQIRFRALLSSGAPASELTAAVDSMVGSWSRLDRRMSHPSMFAHSYLDIAQSLRERGESLPVAAAYARRAAGAAGSPQSWLHGHALRTLAAIQRAQGRRDSAVLTLRAAIDSLHERDQETLVKDLRFDLGLDLEEAGRYDEAITALFECAAIDPADSMIALVPLRRLWKRRFGTEGDLEKRVHEARFMWNEWGGGMSLGDPERSRAPEWRLDDLTGRAVSSAELLGMPTVLVFWGTWSESNREIVKLAAAWGRRAKALGIRVVTINWELPGPGPISLGSVRRFAREKDLPFPVLIDHDRQVFRAFFNRAYPQVLLIDSQGQVRRRTIGWVPQWGDSLTAWIETLGGAGRR